MKIHYLQHVPFEDLGSIAAWADAKKAKITHTRLFRDERLPACADFDWLIVMGGPMNIHEENRYPWLKREKEFIGKAIKLGKTVLGICLGAQLIADVLGAEVYANGEKEIGWFPIKPAHDLQDRLLKIILGPELEAMHWHGDTFSIPDQAVRLASSEVCKNQGFIYKNRVIALQFHLETTAASLKRLISNCQNELTQAPHIQNAAEMQADAGRFRRINSVMSRLLDHLDAKQRP
ncbi:MAG: type 1 glutamine amidotransferase [Deltaproteobacteria bacterium]|nr:type 1 glutamine amidotransferase [Deltaproteobacteria bacterium]